jgi:hypothetical protein
MSFKPEQFMPDGEGKGGVDLTWMELKMMLFRARRRICPRLTSVMLYLEYFAANLVRACLGNGGFKWMEEN